MSKFYYNSVLLPEIPTVDGYPYVWIRANNNSGNYDLLCSQTPWYKSGSNLAKTTISTKWYTIGISSVATATEWSFKSDYSSELWGEESGRSILWSSHDVPNGSLSSTDIYFRATKPVSEEEVYQKIEDIVAGVGKATQLRTSSKQDDATDTVTGVDWFSYGGTVCNNIYANGNGWIGFGASSEHLKVNRRDQAMWNLWREEGTVKNRRFLRIRWSGYTTYNSTSASALLTFDVILLETGDIVLYISDVPTDNYTGTFALGSLTYEKPTADNSYVTFYLQADGSYVADYAPINLSVKKYLVRNGNTLYTVTDGALVELSGTLNADLFINSGIDTMPDGALLMTLSAPEVLCWTDGEKVPTLTATVQGMPQGTHEIISDEANVGHESVYGITSVEATASDGATFLLSFDGGMWMTYTNGSWSASEAGMTASELMAVPKEVWQSVINSAQNMRLKAIIGGENTVTQVKFNFNNIPPV